MPITDTSPAMREAYYRRLAEMTPSERVRITADLWEAGHALQCAGVRQQFPDADEHEVIFRWRRPGSGRSWRGGCMGDDRLGGRGVPVTAAGVGGCGKIGDRR